MTGGQKIAGPIAGLIIDVLIFFNLGSESTIPVYSPATPLTPVIILLVIVILVISGIMVYKLRNDILSIIETTSTIVE
ncbi:MAG: hypothetical protein ACXAEU_13045 [Candidatus Hodarchaeales archaeon]|jgi:uncharacterized membrane protein YcaP (DUF421 family)